jgi:hypothetical protein
MKQIQMWNIPQYSDKASRWEVQVDLSGKRYKLHMAWNSRMKSWVLSIFTTDDVLILGGIRLSVGTYLLGKYKAIRPDLPPGELFVQDITNQLDTAEVGRNDFSIRYSLVYMVYLDDNGNYVEVE